MTLNIAKFCDSFFHCSNDKLSERRQCTLYFMMKREYDARPHFFNSIEDRLNRQCTSLSPNGIIQKLLLALNLEKNTYAYTRKPCWITFAAFFKLVEIIDRVAYKQLCRTEYSNFKEHFKMEIIKKINFDYKDFLDEEDFDLNTFWETINIIKTKDTLLTRTLNTCIPFCLYSFLIYSFIKS